jgi:UPF0716 family protein affecting phage T7 exclusion
MRFGDAETARSFAIRLQRPGLWIAVWLLIEIALASLLARQIGWGLTLLALLGKSGFGFLFLLVVTGRALGKIAAGPDLLMQVQRIGFAFVAGLLLILPGFLALFLALALLAPGLRGWVMSRFMKPASGSDPDGVVTLNPDEWRDVTPAPAAIEPDIRQRP